MRLSFSLFFIIQLIFAGCSLPNKNNNIKKIEFSTEGINISIDSNLTYYCYSCGKSKLKGYYKGKVSQLFWDSLNMKIDSVNLNKLHEVDCHNEFDPGVELIVTTYKNRQHFKSGLTCLPPKTVTTFRWIANSYKSAALTPTTEAVNFEVGLLCPPTMKLE